MKRKAPNSIQNATGKEQKNIPDDNVTNENSNKKKGEIESEGESEVEIEIENESESENEIRKIDIESDNEDDSSGDEEEKNTFNVRWRNRWRKRARVSRRAKTSTGFDHRQRMAFYAIRQGPFASQPVIFFGYKDLYLYSEFVKTLPGYDGNIKSILSYKICNRLADALDYIYCSDEELKQLKSKEEDSLLLSTKKKKKLKIASPKENESKRDEGSNVTDGSNRKQLNVGDTVEEQNQQQRITVTTTTDTTREGRRNQFLGQLLSQTGDNDNSNSTTADPPAATAGIQAHKPMTQQQQPLRRVSLFRKAKQLQQTPQNVLTHQQQLQQHPGTSTIEDGVVPNAATANSYKPKKTPLRTTRRTSAASVSVMEREVVAEKNGVALDTTEMATATTNRNVARTNIVDTGEKTANFHEGNDCTPKTALETTTGKDTTTDGTGIGATNINTEATTATAGATMVGGSASAPSLPGPTNTSLAATIPATAPAEKTTARSQKNASGQQEDQLRSQAEQMALMLRHQQQVLMQERLHQQMMYMQQQQHLNQQARQIQIEQQQQQLRIQREQEEQKLRIQREQEEEKLRIQREQEEEKLRIRREQEEQKLRIRREREQRKEEAEWNKNFELLRQFKEEHGKFSDCIVPEKESESENDSEFEEKYKPLIPWLRMQRKCLVAFQNRKPHLANVGNADKKSDFVEVGGYRMSKEQQEKIIGLGYDTSNLECSFGDTSFKNISHIFLLDKEIAWNIRYDLLKKFRAEFGTCEMWEKDDPRMNGEYKDLIDWVEVQRKELQQYDRWEKEREKEKEKKFNFRKPAITSDQRQKLLNIPLTYGLARTIQKKIEELRDFKEKYGHTDPPVGSSLRSWTFAIRRYYKDLQDGNPTSLTLDHVLQLTRMGFELVSDKSKPKKVDHTPAYIEFVKKHGRFPDRNSPMNTFEAKLAGVADRWRQKRRFFERGIMRSKRVGNTEIPQKNIDALDAIGFRWQINEKVSEGVRAGSKKRLVVPWEERFEMLKAYKEKHGHCEPPRRHRMLGKWCIHQRNKYRSMEKGNVKALAMEQFRKLSEIGFRFKMAGPGHSRTRYVDDGSSSGYDTPDDKDDNNMTKTKRRKKKSKKRSNDNEENEDKEEEQSETEQKKARSIDSDNIGNIVARRAVKTFVRKSADDESDDDNESNNENESNSDETENIEEEENRSDGSDDDDDDDDNDNDHENDNDGSETEDEESYQNNIDNTENLTMGGIDYLGTSNVALNAFRQESTNYTFQNMPFSREGGFNNIGSVAAATASVQQDQGDGNNISQSLPTTFFQDSRNLLGFNDHVAFRANTTGEENNNFQATGFFRTNDFNGNSFMDMSSFRRPDENIFQAGGLFRNQNEGNNNNEDSLYSRQRFFGKTPRFP